MTMLIEFLKLASISSFLGITGGLLFIALDKYLKKKKMPKQSIKIKRTVIPFDYTGKNYNDWIQHIHYLNSVNDVLNDRDTPVTRELTFRLKSENIFKINN